MRRAGEAGVKLLHCILAVVFALSLVGFLTGTAGAPQHPERAPLPEPAATGVVPQARSYREMRQTPRGQPQPWPPNGGETRTPLPESLKQALLERQRRRAYDGAPPTVPHPVRESSAAECMACHGDGLRLGSREAGLVPHDNFTNCNQCHAQERADVPVANGFEGKAPVAHGPRAWKSAPPQIPHTTHMRENCMSCHGPSGRSPMRSSHPERQSCTQCHASSAELDFRP